MSKLFLEIEIETTGNRDNILARLKPILSEHSLQLISALSHTARTEKRDEKNNPISKMFFTFSGTEPEKLAAAVKEVPKALQTIRQEVRVIETALTSNPTIVSKAIEAGTKSSDVLEIEVAIQIDDNDDEPEAEAYPEAELDAYLAAIIVSEPPENLIISKVSPASNNEPQQSEAEKELLDPTKIRDYFENHQPIFGIPMLRDSYLFFVPPPEVTSVSQYEMTEYLTEDNRLTPVVLWYIHPTDTQPVTVTPIELPPEQGAAINAYVFELLVQYSKQIKLQKRF